MNSRMFYLLGLLVGLVRADWPSCLDTIGVYGAQSVAIESRVHIGSTIKRGNIFSGGITTTRDDDSIYGSVLSVGTVTLGNRVILNGSIHSQGQMLLGQNTVVTGVTASFVAVPPCSFAPINILAGTSWKDIGWGAIDTLRPGAYSQVNVQAGATMILQSGRYDIENFVVSDDANILLSGNNTSQLFVSAMVSIGSRVKVRGSQADTSLARKFFIWYSGFTDFRIGQDGFIAAQVAAPNAHMILGSRTKFVGRFAAGAFEAETDVQITPISGSGSVTPPADSTVSDTLLPPRDCRVRPPFWATDSLICGDRSILVGQAGAGKYVGDGYDGIFADSVWSGGNVVLRDRAKIMGSLHLAGSLVSGAQVNISGRIVSDSSEVCEIQSPVSEPGIVGQDISNEEIFVLQPGHWADVVVRSRAKLRVRAGRYDFSSLVLESDASIEAADTGVVDIRIAGNLSWGDRVFVRSLVNRPDSLLARDFRFSVGMVGNLEIGREGVVIGQFTIPQARVYLGARTKYFGSWQAKTLEIENDGVLQGNMLDVSSQVEIISPRQWIWTNATSIPVIWSVRGVVQALQSSEVLPPQDGAYTIRRCFEVACDSVKIHVDRTAPIVKILRPSYGSAFEAKLQTLVYSVDGVVDSESVSLAAGWNTLQRCAEDSAGNLGCDRVRVLLEPGRARRVRFHPSPGSFDGPLNVQMTCDDPRATVKVLSDNLVGAFRTLNNTGNHVLEARCDLPGDPGPITTGLFGIVVPRSPRIPVAPVLDSTTVPLPWTQWNFLYRDTLGNLAVQQGVTDSFESIRVAHISGRVLDRNGKGIPLVRVSIHGQPKLGFTETRNDGEWDLVVKGGVSLLVDYEIPGYLPLQRAITPTPRASRRVDDIVLTRFAEYGSTVYFGATQASRSILGEISEDNDGARQPGVYFPAGLRAWVVDSLGARVEVDHLNIRVTEYTVGSTGRAAMPAELPSATAYTYAVELGADQALNGDKSVEFSDSISLYVTDFLAFGPGKSVPVGWYNRKQGVWVPSSNGQIIQVLSIQSGQAVISVDSSGSPATTNQLLALHISDEELQELAALYPPGASIWRARMSHLTPWDLNWGWALDNSSVAWRGTVGYDEHDAQGCSAQDCQIDITNAAIQKKVSLGLSGESLVYRSDRVAGRLASWKIRVPLTGDILPKDLLRVEVRITVDGAVSSQVFAAKQNLVFDWVWNGLDRFGRKIQGRRPVTVEIGMTYKGSYQAVNQFGGTQLPGVVIDGNRDRMEATLWTTKTAWVGEPSRRPDGLGGWTFSRHHWYDPLTQTMHMGDGRQVKGSDIGWVIRGIASGVGGAFSSGMIRYADGYYLANSNFDFVKGDGTLDPSMDLPAAAYGTAWDLVRIGEDSITGYTVDGRLIGYSRENGSFRIGQIDSIGRGRMGIERLPDGRLLIASGEVILSRDPTGSISVFAGNGVASSVSWDGWRRATDVSIHVENVANCGDWGVLAASALNPGYLYQIQSGWIRILGGAGDTISGAKIWNSKLAGPYGILCSTDGGIWLSQVSGSAIGRIGADSVFRMIAGGGGQYQNDVPALQSLLDSPYEMVEMEDGSVNFCEARNIVRLDNRIRKIEPSQKWVADNDFLIPDPSGAYLHVFSVGGRHLRTLDVKTRKEIRSFEYDPSGRLRRMVGAYATDTIGIQHSSNQVTISSPGLKVVGDFDAKGWLKSVKVPGSGLTVVSSSDSGLITAYSDSRGVLQLLQYDSVGRFTQSSSPDFSRSLLSGTNGLDSSTWVLTTNAGRKLRVTLKDMFDGKDRRKQSRIMRDALGVIRGRIQEYPASIRDSMANGLVDSTAFHSDVALGSGLQMAFERQILTATGWKSDWKRTDTVFWNSTAPSRWDSSLTRWWDSQSSVWETRWTRQGSSIARTDSRLPGTIGSWLIDSTNSSPVAWQPSLGVALSITKAADGVLSKAVLGNRTLEIRRGIVGVVDTLIAPDLTKYLVRQDSTGTQVTSGNVVWSPVSCPSGRIAISRVDADGIPRGIFRSADSLVWQRDSSGWITREDAGAWNAVFTRTSGRSLQGSNSQGVSLKVGRGALVDTVSQLLPGSTLQQIISGWSDRVLTIAGTGAVGNQIFTSAGIVSAYTWENGNAGLKRNVQGWVKEDSLRVGTSLRSLRRVTYDTSGAILRDTIFRVDQSGNKTALWNREYTLDRMARFGVRKGGWTGSSETWAWTYSADGRVRRTVVTASGQTITYNQDWQSPDDFRIEGTTWSRQADSGWLITRKNVTWSYNRSGLLRWSVPMGTQDTTKYSVDAAGRLTRASKASLAVEYILDPLGRRVGRKRNGVLDRQYIWLDRSRLLAEKDGQGALRAWYTWASKSTAPDLVTFGDHTSARLIAEHDGSVRGVYSITNDYLMQKFDYDPVGALTRNEGSANQSLGYLGGLRDDQTGFVLINGVDWIPQLGMWADLSRSTSLTGEPNLRIVNKESWIK